MLASTTVPAAVALAALGGVEHAHPQLAAAGVDEREQALDLGRQLRGRRHVELVDADAAGVRARECGQTGVGVGLEPGHDCREELCVRIAGRRRDGRGCLAAHPADATSGGPWPPLAESAGDVRLGARI